MRIEHVAVWTRHLERLKRFYETYFEAEAGPKYHNPVKQFVSYFLTFPAGGARLELMSVPELKELPDEGAEYYAGYVHLSFSTGSQKQVDALTARLGQDGFAVIDGPRYTGDGYYESKVLDPDGNVVEITI
jgi:lactoylglutathione lyase